MLEWLTVVDLQRLVREQQLTYLELRSEQRLTAEAVDYARQNGIQVSGPRQMVEMPALKAVAGQSLVLQPFGGSAAVAANVRLQDVISSRDGAPLAAGYMSLDEGSFPWTLTYDEIDIVLEGELVITRGEQVARAAAGDCVFIPKGSSITFSTPGHVRFVYVTYPANWN
jgi:ethanolamine utilization protein EutQ